MKKNKPFGELFYRSLKKTLLTMRIAIILLILGILQARANDAYSQKTRLSLNFSETEVVKILDKIETESEFFFLYNEKLLDTERKISITENHQLINVILDNLFAGTDVKYTIIDRKIILAPDFLTKESDAAALMQQQVVTGKVTNSQTGEAMVGVNIVVKGTTTGTATNIDGGYSLSIPDRNATLVVSFIGYVTKEVKVGNYAVINIALATDATSLSEVVVTALGIKREARTLGYATATVAANEISTNRTTSTLGGLQGKLSGVNITLPSTGPQSSTKIRIRGQSSLSGTNSPLIVIDGMPIDNSLFSSGELNRSDGGDGLSSINPDDIESMTVLKGAAASALYGSRAKDGVLMIITKKRGETKGLGIEYTVNFTTQTPLDFTDFQYEYGQGERGIRPTTPWPTSGIWSFGEKFEPGMTQVLFDNEVVPYKPIYNRVKKFYNIGKNLTNTFKISNSGENGGFNLSLSDNNITSILPNSDFNRKIINLGFIQNISKNLTVEGVVNYSNEFNRNPAQIGNQDYSAPSGLMTASNSMPLDLLKKYAFDAEGNELVWARFLPRTNPYFSVSKHWENIKRDRIFGNILLRYQITSWLFIQGRIAQDYYTRFQEYNIPTGYLGNLKLAPPGFVDGAYYQNIRRFRERNYDFLLNATKKFGDIGLDVTFGGNQMYRKSEDNNVAVRDFIERGLYTIGNGRVKSPSYSMKERAVNSLYSSAELSYRNYLFLNLTGRNDWFSTLAPDNRSIFYPSATVSFVFSDALKNSMPDWLTFGKARLAYAQVGDDNVDPYSNTLYYRVDQNLIANPLGAYIPVGSIYSTTIPNSNLRPLRVSEIETGIDLRLFNNAVGFDLSFYRKITKDQIVSAQVSNASSYSTQLINVGKSMNQGIEMTVNITPISTTSFSWNLAANVSYNTSKVLKLGLTDADTIITVGSVRHIVGRPMGQIYARLQKIDDQGRKVFNKNSGFPILDPNYTNIGRNQPDYFGGINNTFTYKRIILSTLITFKLGKDYYMISACNSNYYREGLHKLTLVGRDVGYVIGDGVNENGEVNTTKAAIQPYYESANNNAPEFKIMNAGFWKFSQASLSYDFTTLLPERFFIKGLWLSIVSNNVATLKKWTDNMDPEELPNSISDSDIGGGDSSLPLCRSLGFNLNVKF